MIKHVVSSAIGATSGLLMGLHFAQAAPPQDRAAFVKETMQTMCAGPAQPVIVGTDFSSAGSHDYVVAGVYYTFMDGKEPAIREMGDKTVGALAYSLSALADDIAKEPGQKPSYIMMSLISDALGIDELNFREPSLGLTPENLREKKEAALEALLKHDKRADDLRALQAAVKKLEGLGIPVIVPAGNDFSKKINPMALMSDNVLVGGSPGPYSNRSSLVDFERDDRIEGPVKAANGYRGYDLNGDGMPDIPVDPKHKLILDKYRGQDLQKVLQQIPFALWQDAGVPGRINDKLKSGLRKGYLPEGIYDAVEMAKLRHVRYGQPLPEDMQKWFEGKYVHFPSETLFTLGTDGKLEAPDFSAQGTSYVPPLACALENAPS